MATIHDSNFLRLLGTWKTTGHLFTGQEKLEISGIDTYESVLDGKYILHKADVLMGDERSETLELISLKESAEKAQMHYFNSNGEEGTMVSTIIMNAFTIEGSGLKFTGMIDEHNTHINGTWYMKRDDNSWNKYMDLQLEKQPEA